MARLEHSATSKDVQFEKNVAAKAKELFESAHWKAEKEPKIGATRPDMVVRSPDGTTYVIEVKAGGDRAHFGSLAQVATLKEEYKAVSRESKVYGLLVTNMPAEPRLLEAAKSLDVQIVESAGPAANLAKRLVERVMREKGSK
jgi:hypothetical protein